MLEKCCEADSTKRVLITALDFIKKKKPLDEILGLLRKEHLFDQVIGDTKQFD